MARLTDNDVTRLVARLANEPERPTSPDEAKMTDIQERLLALSGDGSLGPILTQRLAAYLGRPVRCSSGATIPLPDDGPLYLARADGAQVWLRIDPLLASALTDAMIGGDGEAPKVGFGAKVARVAEGAASEMLRAMAAALQLAEPVWAAHDRVTHDWRAQASGTLSVATQEYAWQAGVEPVTQREAPQRTQTHPEGAPALAKVASPPAGHGPQPTTVEAALERVRLELSRMLGTEVTFDEFEFATLAGPRMPHGWLRLSLASRGGGAIVLAVDKTTAAGLVNQALRADVATAADGGVLMETGSEVLVRAALHAFACELGSTPDELHHIVGLSDDAILAQLAHQGIEHRATFGGRSGRLRWLVPERLTAGATASGQSRGGR